ncbi:hypothetical protein [Phreatobacter sp.]|uniref:hypothetical protein n=1 Tax=Phreatobacter sp. TaxID=1966341 RepID=UPI0022BC4F85|nr:hypothetical protein [Phreatobacter sp.]MCZ8314059.1 hypothetical protein [Phreatobacter sp.]
MAFVIFTRPDGTSVGIDPAKVVSFAPVPPTDSPLGGPLSEGTRIVFNNKTHQDVVELIDEVARRFKAAAMDAIAAMMTTTTRPIEMASRALTKRSAPNHPTGRSGRRRATGG